MTTPPDPLVEQNQRAWKKAVSADKAMLGFEDWQKARFRMKKLEHAIDRMTESSSATDMMIATYVRNHLINAGDDDIVKRAVDVATDLRHSLSKITGTLPMSE